MKALVSTRINLMYSRISLRNSLYSFVSADNRKDIRQESSIVRSYAILALAKPRRSR